MASIIKYNSDLSLKENLKTNLENRFQTNFETQDSNLAILADVIGNELISIRNEALEIVEASNFSTANGENLEDLAFNTYGITRRPASRSEVLSFERNIYFYVDDGLTFGDINNNQSITIPAGTRMSSSVFFEDNQTSIIYEVDEDYTLDAGLGIAYVGAKAITTGSDNNVDADSLSYHDFENYTNVNQGQLKVTNRYPILNGSEEETDNNLRFRISNYLQTKTNLNIDALSLKSLEVAGLSEARVLPNYYGVGTVGVVLFGSGNQTNSRLETIFKNRVSELNFLNRKIIVTSGIKVYIDAYLKIFLRKNSFSTEEKRTLKRDIKNTIYDAFRDQEEGSSIDLNVVTETIKRQIGSRDVIGFGSNSQSRNSFENVSIRKTDRDSLFPEEKETIIGNIISLKEDERLNFGIIEVEFEEVE